MAVIDALRNQAITSDSLRIVIFEVRIFDDATKVQPSFYKRLFDFANNPYNWRHYMVPRKLEEYLHTFEEELVVSHHDQHWKIFNDG